MKKLLMMIGAAAVAESGFASNLYWTGDIDNIWSKASNWYNKDTGKVAGSYPGMAWNHRYSHDAFFDQTLANDVSQIQHRVITFELAEMIRGSVYVYDGTIADPIVFSADNDFGLSVTNKDAKFQIGKSGQAGWLKLQGGTFSSAPQLKIYNGGWIVDGGASFATTNHIVVGATANCAATAIFNDGTVKLTKTNSQNCNFIIGNAAGAIGTVTNSGARITVGNSFVLGNDASASAHYYQSGGRLYINNRLTIGSSSSSSDNVFVLDGGEVELVQLFLLDNASFRLKGGSVSFTSIGSGGGSKESEFIFDGGTYITKSSQNLSPFNSGNFKSLTVGENGGTIDTATYSITITHAFASAVDGGIDGGMKFIGGGSASITGNIGYTGPTTVELGTLVTVTDRSQVFGDGKGGLRCSLSEPKPEGKTYTTILTTTGADSFTASDLANCAAADGAGGISFKISSDGKSIQAKRSKGFIISFF